MKTKLALLLFQSSLLFSAAAQWNQTTSPGNWDSNSNPPWSTGAYPNAPGDVANLTSASITTDMVINLNHVAGITVGTINFDSAHNYTIDPSGGKFIFDGSSGNAALTITTANGNGAHTITAPIQLNSPLVITQGSTGTFTISGAFTPASTQSLTLGGTGTLVLSGSPNQYSGGTTINGGTLSIATSDNLGSGSITIGSGTLMITDTITLSATMTLSSSATIDVTSGKTVTISSAIGGSGSLTKTDSGILILSNTSNTYSGGTTINAGTLSISNDSNLGTSTSPLNIYNGTLLATDNITSSRSGTISGSTAKIDTGTKTLTFSGNFSGAGGLTVDGGGTLILTGTNSYTNGTTLTNNSNLQGNTSGLQGNILVNAGSTLTFNQSTNGTYAGVLTGSGALTKTGTGTVQFTGSTGSFTGALTISQGTLNLNGSLGSAATIASGATLSGTGTIGQITSNSGTIDPGNGDTVGTLNVTNTVTLGASSNVNISIAPTDADKIAAGGAFNINGTLTVDPTPGFYGFTASYEIVTASAINNSPFTSVTSTDSNFVPSLTYGATTITLDVTIINPFATFPFANFNEKAVGNNISALHAAGELSSDMTSILDTLVGASNSTVDNALNQMHPAPYSSFTELQSEVDAQLISLFHRLPYLGCACANPNRLWLELFGNSLTLKHHGEQIGSQSNSGGVALGLDRAVTDNFILGVGGAWNLSELHQHDQRGHGTVNGFYGGLYADFQIDQFFLGTALLAGTDFYDTSRHIQFLTTDRHAHSSYNAFDLIAQLQTAYLFGAPQAFFYPYANLDLFYLHTNHHNEKNASSLDLSIHKRTDITLRTEMGLGLQVQDTNYDQTMCISPKITLGWVNLCPIQRPGYQSTFSGATIAFTTHGWNETWNLFSLDFGLLSTYKCFGLNLEYKVEFSPDGHTMLFNQHGNITLDWKW